MKELEKNELMVVDGGLLPIAIFIGIGVFEVCCCIIALGMKARLDQEQPDSITYYDPNANYA